jgi:hypothetical protein
MRRRQPLGDRLVTASEVLAQLRAAHVELRIQGDMLLCRPAEAVSADTKGAHDHKPELQTLLANKDTEAFACPACGELDYMPLGRSWRRCWPCGHRWGPAGTAAPDEGHRRRVTETEPGRDLNPRSPSDQ